MLVGLALHLSDDPITGCGAQHKPCKKTIFLIHWVFIYCMSVELGFSAPVIYLHWITMAGLGRGFYCWPSECNELSESLGRLVRR